MVTGKKPKNLTGIFLKHGQIEFVQTVVRQAYKYQKNQYVMKLRTICPDKFNLSVLFFYEKGRRRKRGLRIETRTCYPRSYNLAPEKL